MKKDTDNNNNTKDNNNSNNSNHKDKQDVDDDALMIHSPFLTTSDVIQQLNKSLTELDQTSPLGQLVQEQPELFDKIGPRFELQKRLPDGLARRAAPDEQATADFETKLQQTADFVSRITKEQRLHQWAEQQRLLGNRMYAAGIDTKAVDVYLTCLVVAQPKMKVTGESAKGDSDSDPEKGGNDNGESNVSKQQKQHSKEDCFSSPAHEKEQLFLFTKVMNNLAQTTLQLGRYQKTVTFCTMALQHCLYDEQYDDMEKELHQYTTYCEHLSKIYYKRGKTQRLRGEYYSPKNRS
jgi:hypothetical protein